LMTVSPLPIVRQWASECHGEMSLGVLGHAEGVDYA
jgi:hypothetical protein